MQMSDIQCNCSTPTDQYPVCSWLVILEVRKSQNHNPWKNPSFPTHPHLYSEHDVFWYRIFHWLFLVCVSGYAPCQFLGHVHTNKTREVEALDFIATMKYISILSTFFSYQSSYWTQKTALFYLLRRKISYIPAKNRSRFFCIALSSLSAYSLKTNKCVYCIGTQ